MEGRVSWVHPTRIEPNPPIKRTVKTNAIVNNAETIILGGLIRTATGKSYTKVPILGDIPIIGQLFRSEAKEQEKTNGGILSDTLYWERKSSDFRYLWGKNPEGSWDSLPGEV